MRLDVRDGIHLTEFKRSDVAALVALLADRAIYDCTLRIPHPYTAADAERWLTISDEATRQNGQPIHWAIRDASGSLIGGVGLDDLVVGQSHRAEIGYWLGKPYWGQGVMTDVVRTVCQYAFNHFGLAKITALVFAGNEASARVLEKCGFEQEGYLRKHHRKDDRFIDAKAYGLLK